MPYSIYDVSNSLNNNELNNIVQQYGSPLWVYHAETIMQKINQLKQFDIIRFAQKACSNVHILKLMLAQNVKVDAVSTGEIIRALVAGYQPKRDPTSLVFTADIIEDSTLKLVQQHRIPVNTGSIDMLRQVGECCPKHPVWLRINPGFGHGHSNKTNTGGENSKHGIWFTELPEAIKVIKKYELQLIGLHMHIGSGVDYQHLSQVCQTMVDVVKNIHYDIHSISAGGGLSIPYHNDESRVDTDHYYYLWDQARQKIETYLGHAISLEIEPGRFLVAESGLLIAEVRAVKQMGSRHFILVNAGFNDLMRPALYGSYHHISLLPKDQRDIHSASLKETVIAGPLCESGDVFTQSAGGTVETRLLPDDIRVGDYLVFHDTGAYGASMSSNYNSRPLLPEVLWQNNKTHLIRRRQTIEDLIKLEL